MVQKAHGFEQKVYKVVWTSLDIKETGPGNQEKEEWLNSVGACIFKARKTRKKLQQTVLQEENLAGHCGGQSEQEPKGGGDEEISKQD